MTTTVGYTRRLVADDTTADREALRAAGATTVFVEATRLRSGETSAWDQCLQILKPGDVLLVTRAARLASSSGRFARAVADVTARGAMFRSLAEDALSTTGAPVAAVDVFVGLDRLRVELTSIRSRKGATDSTVRRGRPSVMTEERIAMARELRRHDRSLKHIAGVLGVSASAVQRALAHPAD